MWVNHMLHRLSAAQSLEPHFPEHRGRPVDREETVADLNL